MSKPTSPQTQIFKIVGKRQISSATDILQFPSIALSFPVAPALYMNTVHLRALTEIAPSG
ncbi:hypothetical protein [Microcoleus sp. herbarium12]|uniref:hypothetical protein n=1 Tax=Microcoleus sp. herbarium12 TaxID=3055437 RepID=UPI002FD22FC2